MSVRNDFIKANARDAEWFLALKEIKRPLLLHALTIDLALVNIEKANVLCDPTYNPVFVYPNLNLDRIVEARKALIHLREQVCQKESNKSIQTLYTNRLDELILEQELLVAAATQDWEAFSEHNKKLYGEINNQATAEQLHILHTRSSVFGNFENKSKSEAALPTLTEFQSAQKAVIGPDILVVPDKEYSSVEIQQLWNEELAVDMPGWKVVIDDSVFHMLVTHRNRTIKVPANLTMKGKRMRKLFLHEIGTHVFRREQGKKNTLQLSSIGLAQTMFVEEGLAIMRAQLAGSKFYQYGGFDKHLTLALATGCIDGVPKNFNETYHSMFEYYLDRLNRKKNSEQNATIAQNRAWNSTLRVFRGGNTNIAGCCLLRDKIYYEGNRMVWNLYITQPECFKHIMLGKFNPANALQLEMMLDGST